MVNGKDGNLLKKDKKLILFHLQYNLNNTVNGLLFAKF